MSRKTEAITKSRPSRKGAMQQNTARSDGASARHETAGLPARPPAPGEGKRGEQGYLGYLLRQAQAAVRLSMDRTLADLGVTPPQFAVLTMLNAYPGLSGADVARLTFLTPQTTGVIIRNLERDGAIRMTPHPVHGRIQQWTLTPHGATLLKGCRQRVLALEQRLSAGLDGKAETTIRRWLVRIAAEMQEG
jgi:DNA-binding MarR family transcriptional regulator